VAAVMLKFNQLVTFDLLVIRGIHGIYLYVCDPALKEYISQYVDTE